MSHEEGPHYVIVGRGFSAVLNYRLLRSTSAGRERVGALPILNIGLTDPWAGYAIERMGQWPGLLTLPGLADQQVNEDQMAFLPRSAFAGATRNAFQSTADVFKDDRVLAGTVERVSPLTPTGQFEVTGTDESGKAFKAIAEKIDFCVGPGLQRKLETRKVGDPALVEEYLNETIAPDPRRLMTGVDFLKHGRRSPPKGAICVFGNGGTGAWCVELALKSDARSVTWVSREPFKKDTFPPSRCNDDLVGPFDRDESFDPVQELTPRDGRLTLACGVDIDRVERTAEGVRVLFRNFGIPTTQTYVDHAGNDLGSLKSGTYDQVIISIGQTCDEGRGCLDRLTQEAMRKKFPIGSHHEGRWRPWLVGFSDSKEAQESRVRILGPAAAKISPRFPGDLRDRLLEYEATFARQAIGAQVATGALSVAYANGYFETKPNSNINTAHSYDLERLGIDGKSAVDLLTLRRRQIEPFTQIPPDLEMLEEMLELHY